MPCLLRRQLVKLIRHFSGDTVGGVSMDNGAALQQQSNTIGTDNLAQYILNLRSQFLQERLGGGLRRRSRV